MSTDLLITALVRRDGQTPASAASGSNPISLGDAKSTSASSAADARSFDDILEAFERAAAQTPNESIRDEILKTHGLNRASYRALPPERTQAIDREVSTGARGGITGSRGHSSGGARV